VTTLVLHKHCIYTGDNISIAFTLYLHRWQP